MQNSPSRYLEARGISAGRKIIGNVREKYSGAVVIPAFAESASLFLTLESLSDNPVEALAEFLVLVVVNNRGNADMREKLDNIRTLEILPYFASAHPFIQLAWIDAASPGEELPDSRGGVGVARKTGLDIAISKLDYICRDPVLVCLDADTLVRPDYLPAITAHFRSGRKSGAVISFIHQAGETETENLAIMRYELFLRAYVSGLSAAGSPYAFHSIGSAMAVPLSAYLKIGGMNCREAGEDFYFLQQISKTCGISGIEGTVVYPSSRPSTRVPFGTGRSVIKQLSGKEILLFYHPSCYEIVKELLNLVESRANSEASAILRESASISLELANFLTRSEFALAWSKLRKNSRDKKALLKAFHVWFDGFRTLKLIHHLSDTILPKCKMEIALPDVSFSRVVDGPSAIRHRLEKLRKEQLGADYEEPVNI